MATPADLDANYTTMPVPDRPRRGTVIDPLTSGMFGPQDAGDGTFTMGNGDGTGVLSGLEALPGSQRWFTAPTGSGDNEQGGRVDPQAFKAWMDENGYSMREESAGGGRVTRWMEDRDGNYVIQPQTMGSDKNWGRDFLVGSLALYGAGSALSGAIGGAGGAGAGTAGAGGTTAASGGGLEAAMAASADGGALAASGSGITGGSAAAAGGGGVAAAGGGSAAGGAAATSGGGLMSGMTTSDWLNLGTTVAGLATRPKTPDTSGINDAARDSAALGRDAFEWFTSELERTQGQRDAAAARADQIAGAQLDGMQFATEEARRAAERRRTVFEPVEDRLVTDAEGFDTPARRAQAVAEATADVEGAASRAQQANQRALMRTGATTSGPAAQALMQDAAMAKAKMVAGATGAATRNVEQQGYARRVDAASIGRGLPATQATQQQIATTTGNASLAAGAAGIQAGLSGVPVMQAGVGAAQQGLSTAGQLFGQAGQLDATTRGQDLNFLGNAFSTYMRSSEKVKSDTGNITNGRKQLRQVMKTPVHEDYHYDPSKGGPPDVGPLTGPMAEDVQANMGEATAPGGEMIDVKRLTGTLMAAVQAVATDVAQIRDQMAATSRTPMKKAKKQPTTQEA